MSVLYSKPFTVFTPTYNRAYCLPRLFKSLKSQTYTDFEWLIVDDGSEDNTSQVVESFYSDCNFPIRYQFQAHQHKKTALNLGVRLAQGKLFLAIDSDDELLPDALAILFRYWEAIPNLDQEQLAGITGLRIDEENQIVGTRFPQPIMDSNSLEIFYRYKVKGDKCGFIKTEILKQFPFPEEIPNHVPEGVVYTKIARKYQTRYINEILLRSYKGSDQITHYKYQLQSLQENAEGHAYWASQVLDQEMDYFFDRPIWFIKMAANYTRFHLHIKKKGCSLYYPLQTLRAKTLEILFYPLGCLRFLLDYRRKN